MKCRYYDKKGQIKEEELKIGTMRYWDQTEVWNGKKWIKLPALRRRKK